MPSYVSGIGTQNVVLFYLICKCILYIPVSCHTTLDIRHIKIVKWQVHEKNESVDHLILFPQVSCLGALWVLF